MKKNNYKKLSLLFLGQLVVWLLVLGVTVYGIDPLQQYRIASFYKPFFGTGGERYLHPGMAKNFDYDSVTIGTSITLKLSTPYIDKILGWKTLKLSMSDSAVYAQRKILETAIASGKVKNVLYGIHYSSFSRPELDYTKHYLPKYLYDLDKRNDFKYLLNFDVFTSILPKIIMANVFGVRKRQLNRDLAYMISGGPNNEKPRNFLPATRHKVWLVGMDLDFADDDLWLRATGAQSHTFKRNFSENILPIIRNNPNINFYLFLPPFHLDYYCGNKRLQPMLDLEERVYMATQGLSNVYLYDFRAEDEIVTNKAYYPKDNFHYDEDANRLIIDMIKSKRDLVHDDYMEYHNKFVNYIKAHCIGEGSPQRLAEE